MTLNHIAVLAAVLFAIWLPLDAWLVAWPSAVRYRNTLRQ